MESQPKVPAWEDIAAPTDIPAGVSSAEFSRRFVAKESTDGLAFYRRMATKRLEQGADRELRAIAGSSEVDTENEIVSVKGTDLGFYLTNPVGLANHDMSQLPIFLTVAINKRKGDLRFTARYAPKDISPLAEAILQNHLWRLEEKALGDSGAMFSVRGMPKPEAGSVTFDEDRGGLNFNKQTLLEISDVTIGAQPRAQLLKAQAAGIDMEPVLEWALGTVEVLARGLEQKEADQLVKALGPLKGLKLFEISRPDPAEEKTEKTEPTKTSPDTVGGDLEKRIQALETAATKAAKPPATPDPEPEKSPEYTPGQIDEMAAKVIRDLDGELVRKTGCGI